MENFCKISSKGFAPAREYLFALNLYYGYNVHEESLLKQIELSKFCEIEKANEEKEKIDILYALINKYLLTDCSTKLNEDLVYEKLDNKTIETITKYVSSKFHTSKESYEVIMKILFEAYYYLEKPLWGEEQPDVDEFNMLSMAISPFLSKIGIDIGNIKKEDPEDEDLYFYMNKEFKTLIENYNEKCFNDESLNLYSVHNKKADLNNPFIILDKTLVKCDRLISKVVSIPKNIVTIGKSAFSSCDKISEIIIPDSVNKIEDYAFYDCSSLEKIELPESVKFLGEGAFSRCSSLTKIEFPTAITCVPTAILKGCKKLTEIIFKAPKIECIKDQAFWGTAIKIYTIPNGITKLEEYTFNECKNLKVISIPASIQEIGECALSDCPELTKIVYQGSYTQWQKINKDAKWNTDTVNYYLDCKEN